GPSASPAGSEQLAIDLGPERSAEALGRFEVVGQIFEGYFVCEGDGEVLLVDQHAGHERVLFERLMQAFAERDVARQALLIPERVHVGREGVEACAAATAELEALGWEVEAFGDEDVVVRAVPAMAGATDARALVEAVAVDLVEAGRARSAERLAERIMATVACHSAVRVGKRLGVEAARALLREMATVSYHATCPHGRPVARRLVRGQVERMFGR
ncbi:MAG: DNA mismatch repair protein MutL, partial [Candidatus Binatia bacterium]